MRDFDYSKRGRDVEVARAEVHAAANAARGVKNESDPRKLRWSAALEVFHAAYARVYPDALRQVDEGSRRASNLETQDILDFLEADPVFYRSGYMKEKLLTALKQRIFDPHEVTRLQAIIINVVQKPDRRREFRRYCRVAAVVDDERFRDELKSLEQSDDPDVGRRANWVLAGLEGKWIAISRASRMFVKGGPDDGYRRVANRVSRDDPAT